MQNTIMNYGDLATNVENSRNNLRRIARHEETEFSNSSILKSMERFVQTVNEMEETILVPSRLLDLTAGDANDPVCVPGKNKKHNIQDKVGNTDLYRLYNIVNQMKLQLLWSQESCSSTRPQQHEDHANDSEGKYVRSMTKMGHARCPSTTSMQSVQSASSIVSTSSMDSDSDAGIENDSGLESEDSPDRLANLLAENFRRNLHGLHRSINLMAEAAEYLTHRYQADVGGQV